MGSHSKFLHAKEELVLINLVNDIPINNSDVDLPIEFSGSSL